METINGWVYVDKYGGFVRKEESGKYSVISFVDLGTIRAEYYDGIDIRNVKKENFVPHALRDGSEELEEFRAQETDEEKAYIYAVTAFMSGESIPFEEEGIEELNEEIGNLLKEDGVIPEEVTFEMAF